MDLYAKVYAWFNERIDLDKLRGKMLNEPMAGGARWAYVFGSCLLMIFALQVITGILLMFYYGPTVDHAWESTKYILEEVNYGWFVLSFHLWGASAMVTIMVVHMSQVFLWGAYKKPRELIWLAGTVLFVLVLALGFTGYLLPWDQRAYWATVVGLEIVDKTPFIGDILGRFLRGGPVPGAHTLSRFFVLHVMILPLLVAAVAGLHLFFFRKAGPAGPFKGSTKVLREKMEWFFPRQVFMDLAFFALVFVSIGGLAATWPHELVEEASPQASDIDPEPEWYFLFLFQLLRDPALSFMFAGEFGEFLGAIVIPGLFMLVLVALPFLDRNPERNPRKRPLAVSAWTVIMISIVVLTIRALQFRD